MRDYVEGVWSALNDKNGYFYVCGYVQPVLLELGSSLYSYFFFSDARVMARDVHETLEYIVETAGKKTRDEAIKYVENLQKSGRYLSDTWF